MMCAIPTNDQCWLICGGRSFADEAMFQNAMLDLMSLYGCPRVVVHGAAPGADSMADAWARRMACEVIPVPANWKVHGKAAGPMRNQKMLDRYRPHLVIAFPGGKGTADMVSKAREAGVNVAEIREKEPAHGR